MTSNEKGAAGTTPQEKGNKSILPSDQSGVKKTRSWRDVYKIHPAADIFPMLPEDELRKLGQDIKANGLKEQIILWASGVPKHNEDQKTKDTQGDWLNEIYLLDGRNRLGAMELCGLDVSYRRDRVTMLCYGTDNNRFGNQASRVHFELGEEHTFTFGKGGSMSEPKVVKRCDPYAYVISRNIHRRHLTKEQQADLIVQAMKLKTDLATVAKSVPRDSKGHIKGSTKNPLKQAAVEEAKKHGISQRTVEKALSKDRPKSTGPVTSYLGAAGRKKAQENREMREQSVEAEMRKPGINSNEVARKVIAFLEKQLVGARGGDIFQVKDLLLDYFRKIEKAEDAIRRRVEKSYQL